MCRAVDVTQLVECLSKQAGSFGCSVPRHGGTHLKSPHSGGGGRTVSSEIQSYPRLLHHEFKASTDCVKPYPLHLIFFKKRKQ